MKNVLWLTVKHSLLYFLTTSPGVQTFPEFVAVSVVDGVQVGYCDSDIKTAEPRQDWVKKLVEDDPQQKQWHIQTCIRAHQDLKALLETLKQQLDPTGEFVGTLLVDGVPAFYCDSHNRREVKQDVWETLFEEHPELLDLHIADCSQRFPRCIKSRLQSFMQHFNQSGGTVIEGCEWDEKTKTVSGYLQFGYDGEEFISLDLKTRTWIVLKPEADSFKRKWDAADAILNEKEDNLIRLFPEWLETYLTYGKSFLLKTVSLSPPDLPSVSLLQKSPSSPVSCHATGFYPDRATMFWRKDGQELHEDVDHGEILPNHDGTFQMTVDLNIKSVKPEDWRRYDCVFNLSGVDDIVTKLEKTVIRTNVVPPSQVPVGAVIRVVVGLMLLSVCITGLFIRWKKKDEVTVVSLYVEEEEK
ncbi:major histocompatibility complex class I-related gene protein-like [Channa argus]|uniref:major histocompatibility complex class I-related gene protein-like n=1 Tax=Channa argus TaxID=215402 RepID=UPI00351FA699